MYAKGDFIDSTGRTLPKDQFAVRPAEKNTYAALCPAPITAILKITTGFGS